MSVGQDRDGRTSTVSPFGFGTRRYFLYSFTRQWHRMQSPYREVAARSGSACWTQTWPRSSNSPASVSAYTSWSKAVRHSRTPVEW